MKFTDALRLADELEIPDQRHTFVIADISKWNGEKPLCCAIGGANAAAGKTIIEVREHEPRYLTVDSIVSFRNWSHWPALATPFSGRRPSICLSSGLGCEPRVSVAGNMAGAVIHLYDKHNFSRTQIAEYLEKRFSKLDWEETK